MIARAAHHAVSAHRWWCYLVGWVLGSLLMAGISSARAENQPRVGMFGLYHAQSMLIQPVGHSPIVLQIDRQRELWYPQPESALDIERKGERLQFRLTGTNQRSGLSRSATQISLKSAVAADSPVWQVMIEDGRLVRRLRGSLRFRLVDGAIQTVLETDLESVVARVVASEMSGIAELESLKALAVVARTFILASLSRHQDEGFDFCDTTHCQWYQGEDRLGHADRFSNLVEQAVRETENSTLSFHGVLRPTYFTSSCGGITTTPEAIWNTGAAPEAAGYQSVSCDWCRASKFYRWQRRVRKTAFMAVVSELIGFMPSLHAEVIPELNDRGFVPAVWIRDGQRRTRLAGDALRSQAGRRLGWNWILSNAYTIEDSDGWLVFRGRGFGHNVGLCLSGAAAQARAGRVYEDILRYYFPLAELRRGRPSATRLVPFPPLKETDLPPLPSPL